MNEDGSLEQRAQLDRFFAAVERRALYRARLALGNREDALDAVQDAMLRLVRRYAERPEAEWPALFHRVLENRIRDLQRRRAVRARFGGWLPRGGAGGDDEHDEPDRFAQAPDLQRPGPQRSAQGSEAMQALEAAVAALPRRQQQAFTLRAIQQLDVAQTASAMGLSTGSVKTHYSRALTRLRMALAAHADQLWGDEPT